MLINATKIISKIIKPKDLIIFESTVFPGTTEEICIPIIEKLSKLKLYNKNLKTNNFFYSGYSPERINPTDKTHTIYNTNKIVGQTLELLSLLKICIKKLLKQKFLQQKVLKSRSK